MTRERAASIVARDEPRRSQTRLMMMAVALEQLEVGRRLAAEHLDGHAHFPEGLLIAVGVALLGQLQQWRDVDAAAAQASP